MSASDVRIYLEHPREVEHKAPRSINVHAEAPQPQRDLHGARRRGGARRGRQPRDATLAAASFASHLLELGTYASDPRIVLRVEAEDFGDDRRMRVVSGLP